MRLNGGVTAGVSDGGPDDRELKMIRDDRFIERCGRPMAAQWSRRRSLVVLIIAGRVSQAVRPYRRGWDRSRWWTVPPVNLPFRIPRCKSSDRLAIAR